MALCRICVLGVSGCGIQGVCLTENPVRPDPENCQMENVIQNCKMETKSVFAGFMTGRIIDAL